MKIDKIIDPIQDKLVEFEKYFNEHLKSPVPLLNMVLKYVSHRNGKKLRPALVFLVSSLFGEINKRSFVGATMIELLHTATLLHDDVVDEANERRGFLSINAIWKNRIAILAGDFLLAKGLLTAVENNEFEFLKVTSNAVQKMSEGELLSMESSRKLKYSEELYYEITKNKTAVLMRSCCEIGSLSQNQPLEIVQSLGNFGEYLGMAFQIKDDIFDYTKSNFVIGKPVGNDLKEKKITLPLLLAFKNAQKDEIENIIKKIKSGKLDKKQINEIIEFVKDRDGVKLAEAKALEFANKAVNELNNINESPFKNSLKEFSLYIIERDK
jgi:octaprenyl-diphosphate synthase